MNWTSIVSAIAAGMLSAVAMFTPVDQPRVTTVENDPTIDTVEYDMDYALNALRDIYGNDDLTFVCHTERYEGSSDTATAWVIFGGNMNEIHLLSRLCREISGMENEIAQAEPALRTWVVLNILNHEAVHTTGIQSEMLTECQALNTTDVLARELGMPEENIELLQNKYYTNVYVGFQREGYYDENCVVTF